MFHQLSQYFTACNLYLRGSVLAENFCISLSTAWGAGGVPSCILHLLGWLEVHNRKTQEKQDLVGYSQGKAQLIF